MARVFLSFYHGVMDKAIVARIMAINQFFNKYL